MNAQPAFRAFLSNLKKKKIIEILAAFIAGGWLFIEFVHFILIGHYHFPEKTLDFVLVTLIGILLCTLIWRWFSGREQSRKFKLEIVLIPVVVLVVVLLDLNLFLHYEAPESETVYAAPTWKYSVAVLPFVDMSPQKDQEYFCDGMTENLIDRLSNIRELKVPARTSAFMFKGKTPDMHDVGEKLKVEKALEGSVQKSGNRLRITVQFINIADGYHIWSQTFDRELKDVFAIQDEIGMAIVDKLQIILSSQEKQSILKHPMDNVAAYEWYLRAKPEIFRFTKESVDLALRYLQSGLNLMGENAALYAGLAAVYCQYFNIGVMQEDGVAKAFTELSKIESPICSNILHKIAGTKNITVLTYEEQMEDYT